MTSSMWNRFERAAKCRTVWERPESNSGLLLPICGHCGHTATRATYVGFWKEFITLIQDMSVTAIAVCPACDQDNQYIV